MASPWCRLWSDMPNDPKWRTIARASGQSIGNVIAVYVHMMTCASSQPNATERGQTIGWCDEDIATALDIETDQVVAIRGAMDGRVRDGDYLTGWDRRQSVREDEGAAQRAKEWREREKAKKEAGKSEKKTQPNATERNRTTEVDVEVEVDTEVEKKEQKAKSKASASGSRLPADWRPTDADIEYCKTERPDLRPSLVATNFFDYWTAKAGAAGRKADWSAAWRSWVRKENAAVAGRAVGSPVTRSQPDLDEIRRQNNEEAKRLLGFGNQPTTDEERTIDV